jgi:hypothetical protein
MALWDEVLLRYSAQSLKELTTVDQPGATNIDTTKGTQVATDVQSWFKRVVQEDYDNTNADHKAVAVRAVWVMLREYSGRFSDVVQRELEEVEKKMNQLRDLGAGKRITPHTDSELDPSDDEGNLNPQRPIFDTKRFGDTTLSEPSAP